MNCFDVNNIRQKTGKKVSKESLHVTEALHVTVLLPCFTSLQITEIDCSNYNVFTELINIVNYSKAAL